MTAFGTITATAAQLRAGSLSPVALMEATLDRIAHLVGTDLGHDD